MTDTPQNLPTAGAPAVRIMREAAVLMRERAEGVTQGAQWTGGNYWITDYDPADPTGQTAMQRLIGGMDGPDADHYASWPPAVALAVAAWLEQEADDLESDPDAHTYDEHDLHGCLQSAIAAARAYLGSAA